MWLGEQSTSEASMNSRLHRTNLQNLAVLDRRFIPFALKLESLSIQEMNLKRKGSFVSQVLRCSHCQIGVGMGCGIQHFRITRKIPTQYNEEIEGLIRNIVSHGAMQAIETDALLDIFIACLMNLFLEQRKSLFAVSILGQSQAVLRLTTTGRAGTFRRVLPGSSCRHHAGRGQK